MTYPECKVYQDIRIMIIVMKFQQVNEVQDISCGNKPTIYALQLSSRTFLLNHLLPCPHRLTRLEFAVEANA